MTRPFVRRNQKSHTEFITFSFLPDTSTEDRVNTTIEAGLRNVRDFDGGVVRRYQAEVPYRLLKKVETFLRNHPLILSVSTPPAKKNIR